MADLDTELETNLLARILIYGAAKTKKTWWAGRAAEAGFNVLLLDGEGGFGILKNLTPEARQRVTVLNIQDSPKQAKMALFMARFCKMNKFWWQEKDQLPSSVASAGYTLIDPTALTPNDVVVLDSYTALVWSLTYRFAIEHSIDLSDAAKIEWDGYGWAANLATWVLNQLKTLPCHFIMIAHADQYDKISKRDNKTVEFSRMQVKSTSRPHAMQIPNKFDDIYFFYAKGSAFKIDTASDTDRDGGSRFVPPKVYSWNDLQFADVCKIAGIPIPENAPPLSFIAEDKPSVQPNSTEPLAPVDATGEASKVEITGKASLFLKSLGGKKP